MQTEHKQYKITLIGDGGVGKTSFIKKLNGELEYPSNNIIKNIDFFTNHGKYTCQVWDENYLNAGIDADGIIVMFDVTSKPSLNAADDLVREFRKQNTRAPAVICGNKIDKGDHVITPTDIREKIFIDTQCFDISVKNNHNLEKPILYLLKSLSGHSDLVLV